VARPSVTISQAEPHAVIVMLVDVSGSMEASDVKPNRITAATSAMRTFITKLPNRAEVGLVEFSTEPSVVELPTSDHDEVTGALELLAPNGATALGDGLGTAIKIVQSTLAHEGAKRQGTELVPGGIVLLSDGAQNRGALRPLQAAAQAKAAGIRVYAISFGTAGGTMRFEGVPGVVPVPPDPTTMQAIAKLTGGQMFSARTAGEAANVYGSLGSTIARTHVRHDLTAWFSFGAGLLLLGALGAGLAIGPVLP
jgi:Ca-activated chloride channel family protein